MTVPKIFTLTIETRGKKADVPLLILTRVAAKLFQYKGVEHAQLNVLDGNHGRTILDLGQET
jgi:hypothetical protein